MTDFVQVVQRVSESDFPLQYAEYITWLCHSCEGMEDVTHNHNC